MTTVQPELSGVDLARQALTAAREAAKKNGATAKKPKRRTTTVVRRDGREPLGLGSAISRMLTERGMTGPAAGGSVLARFDAILTVVAPELVGRVRAVGYDADTGRLDVVPDIPAVATKLRWTAPKLAAAANAQVPGANVRTVHVLPPAPATAGPAVAAEPVPPTVPAGPAVRLPAPAGYHEALAAHRATRQEKTVTDSKVQAAAERQIREQAREPEELFGDGRKALEELAAKAAAQQRAATSSDAARARALQRLAAERAGLTTIPPAGVREPLHRTA
ncbi:DciA family protein [Streptomyces sp. AM 2-1-1]|uniref:DciA family protein n=1 Tax=Streptomyces sp. AM 2-1-1 TaxID=3028709 RepID=UPI0023B9C443|nr:DciA family protein [Streptomyces sp. AM 2-1-1]WEH43989.1 DciA family protein [Streptomyces sp. AM 2-1-1]